MPVSAAVVLYLGAQFATPVAGQTPPARQTPVVDMTGKVVFVRVGQAFRSCTLEAIKCVREWKFQPAMFNGKPIPVFYTVTVNFELR